MALVHKTRPKGTANQVQALQVVGDIEGKRCILIDDMIDTAGTICAAAELLEQSGASEVWALATHGVLSDPAAERLSASKAITKVVITDTLPISPLRRFEKLEVLSVSSLIADTIGAVFEETSVSEIFGGENLA
jgi:ribose-phosphate pyrophosphokinase